MLEQTPDEVGEIRRRHGELRIGELRKLYGKQFALGCHDRGKLKNALRLIDATSLTRLLREHEAGRLDQMFGRRDFEEQSAWTVGVQYAALPYRIDGRSVEVLLVDSPDSRLGIPKVWPIKGISPPAAAALEVMNTVGLAGHPETVPVGSYNFRQTVQSGDCVKVQAIVFPFRIFRLAESTRPSSYANAIWTPYRKAAARVHEPTLKRLILEFGRARTPNLHTLLGGLWRETSPEAI